MASIGWPLACCEDPANRERTSMSIRLGAATAAALAAMAAPAAADGATVKTDRACYAPIDVIRVSGTGFAPNGAVAISEDGRPLGFRPTDVTGGFFGDTNVPFTSAGERRTSFEVSDASSSVTMPVTATATARITAFEAHIGGLRAFRPQAKLPFNIRGFTRSRSVYAHVRRGRALRNIRLGAPKAPCGTLSVRKALFPRRASVGIYTVQIDGARRYSPRTVPNLSTRVRLFRTAARSSADTVPASPWPSRVAAKR
jgi:hypothetical protein